jgi:hypothetical protein
MEFRDTVSDATLIGEAIAAALGSSNIDGAKDKPDDDSFQDKVKDHVLGAIIGGTMGGLATVAGAVYMYFRNKVCSQTDENEQPNATAQAPIEASAEAPIKASIEASNPLQATVGYSTANDEEELDSQKGAIKEV